MRDKDFTEFMASIGAPGAQQEAQTAKDVDPLVTAALGMLRQNPFNPWPDVEPRDLSVLDYTPAENGYIEVDAEVIGPGRVICWIHDKPCMGTWFAFESTPRVLCGGGWAPVPFILTNRAVFFVMGERILPEDTWERRAKMKKELRARAEAATGMMNAAVREGQQAAMENAAPLEKYVQPPAEPVEIQEVITEGLRRGMAYAAAMMFVLIGVIALVFFFLWR